MTTYNRNPRIVTSFDKLVIGQIYDTRDRNSEMVMYERGYKLEAIVPAADRLHHAIFRSIEHPGLVKTCTERTWTQLLPFPKPKTAREEAAEKGYTVVPSEAARILGIPPHALERARYSWGLNSYAIGKYHFYKREDLEQFKREHEGALKPYQEQLKRQAANAAMGDYTLTARQVADMWGVKVTDISALGFGGKIDRATTKLYGLNYLYSVASVKHYAEEHGLKFNVEEK